MKTTCWNCGGALFVVFKVVAGESRGRWTFCFGCDTKMIEHPVIDGATGAVLPTQKEIVGPPVVVREMMRRMGA